MQTQLEVEPTGEDIALALKYQKKTQYEHIRDLPDTYIGSIVCETVEQYVYDNIDAKDSIVKKKIDYVPGLFKIFDEIIVNANDNGNRIDSKIATGDVGLAKMTTLKVNIFEYTDDVLTDTKWAIKVYNDGEGIDIAKHPVEHIWIPQMIFAELLTSGNYNKAEEKITGGKNGYGAKLTNIFSKLFIITTVDKQRKLKYTQVYRNNMLDKEPPIIEKYTDAPFTEITFVPDYGRFSMPDLSDDMIALFRKRTYDMAFTSKNGIDVWFNDTRLELKSCIDYIHYYLPESEHIAYTIPHQRWYVAACMAPNFQFTQVSFVNGICTIRGGRHVDYVTKQITSKLASWILKKRKVEVRESFIKDNLMVFVNSIIVNPSFDSQTKETLTTNIKDFGSKFDLDEKFIEHLADCGIVDRALAQTQFQESQVLKKTDGKKIKRILDIEKLEDADDAGTKNSNKCTLILTEGDSAKAMAMAGVGSIVDGRKIYGIFPLKGKLQNTRDKKEIELVNNKEITNIKRILGLQEGEIYTDTNKLRYGRIMILTDADEDGNHIKGLVINYISSHFGSLLLIDGFITSMLTPIVKVTKGKKGKDAIVKSFYCLPEYETWLSENNGGKGWTSKYYKGLGTSTSAEAKQYFSEFKQVFYHWDDKSNESIDMAFNKLRADDRKEWLKGYDGRILDLGQNRVTFTDFINHDLIRFSVADNVRSIPNLMDGLKPSLRKILFCCFKKNLTDEIKVAQLAGYVSEKGGYHHGEASLQGTIVHMAQDFPGSNNINLLQPEGQFGTRIMGGEDSAQPRYIFTYLVPLTFKIFKKVDEPLLKNNVDDGVVIEPEYYMPILPMLLVNGSEGIGTGWSSSLPQFNPLDLVTYIKNKIAGIKTAELLPWYRGYKGEISKTGKASWLSRGKYKVINDKTVEITELPIGTWIHTYECMLKEMLLGLSEEKKKAVQSAPLTLNKMKQISGMSNVAMDLDIVPKILKDYKSDCGDFKIKFTLTFEPEILNALLTSSDTHGINEFERRFKMVSKMAYNKTMNFFGPDGKLMHFTNVESIIDTFYDVRLAGYDARRVHLLADYKRRVELIGVKVRFIMEIIDGHIKINNVAKSIIEEQLKLRNYPVQLDGELVYLTESMPCGGYQYLISMPLYNLTKERIDEFVAEKTKIDQEYAVLQSKSGSDLWIDDLNEFVVEYDKFMTEYYEAHDVTAAEFIGTCKPQIKLDMSRFKFG